MSCQVVVFVDGVEVNRSIYEHDVRGRDIGVVDSVWAGKHSMRKFVFAKAITSVSCSNSEDRPGRGTHRHPNEWTGQIAVAVNRVNVGEERPWVAPIEPFDLKLSGPVREDEKATSHVVELGDEMKGGKDISDFVYVHTTPLLQDPKRDPEQPDFFFTFIYRPREELQALGVVAPKKRVSSLKSSGQRKRAKTVPEIIEISSDSENEDKGRGSSEAMVKMLEKQIAAQLTEIETQKLEIEKERVENQEKFSEMQKQQKEIIKLLKGLTRKK